MRDYEQLKTLEVMKMLKPELDNWIRWGLDKRFYPKSYTCIMRYAVKLPDRGDLCVCEYVPPVDVLAAEDMEDIVRNVPKKKREAFLLYVLGKASVNEKREKAKRRIDGAKVLHICERQYNRLVRDALNHIARWY